MDELDKQQAIDWLSQIIQFKTISGEGPSGSYDQCATWLLHIIKDIIGLDCEILTDSLPSKPIVVARWDGSEPDLPVVILNSHYDVVPVEENYWTMPTFAGLVKDGRCYGRGTQDMKSVCVQYLVAIHKLKKTGFQPKRTILLTYVPDEEIGGNEGMKVLLESKYFTDIHSHGIAVALDEGLASEDESYALFYGERLPWWVSVTALGNTGHASRFIDGTAVEQLLSFSQKALAFRQEQRLLLHGQSDNEPRYHHENCSHVVAAKKRRTIGDVTSLNITSIHAGVKAGNDDALNVVPPMANAKLDIRIAPHVEPKEIANKLDLWCQEVKTSTSGLPSHGGISWEILRDPLMEHHTTKLDLQAFEEKNMTEIEKLSPETRDNQIWMNIIRTILISQFGIDIYPSVFPAATDSRFLRALGVRAFGFSPMRNSPILLHEHDEYISLDVYLEGCEVYIKLIEALANAKL